MTMLPLENTPMISAMMPAYNEEAVIGKAIQSILDQTYEDWELVIVDDGLDGPHTGDHSAV